MTTSPVVSGSPGDVTYAVPGEEECPFADAMLRIHTFITKGDPSAADQCAFVYAELERVGLPVS